MKEKTLRYKSVAGKNAIGLTNAHRSTYENYTYRGMVTE